MIKNNKRKRPVDKNIVKSQSTQNQDMKRNQKQFGKRNQFRQNNQRNRNTQVQKKNTQLKDPQNKTSVNSYSNLNLNSLRKFVNSS